MDAKAGASPVDILNIITKLTFKDDAFTIGALAILAVCFLAAVVMIALKRPVFALIVFLVSVTAVVFLENGLLVRAGQLAGKEATTAPVTRQPAATPPPIVKPVAETTQAASQALQARVQSANEKLAALIAQKIDAGRKVVSADASARCHGGGDRKSATVTLSAGDGFVFDGDVNSKVSGQYDSHDSVQISTENGQQVARQKISCHSPGQLWGPGGWANGSLSAKVRPVLRTEEIDALRKQVASEFQVDIGLIAQVAE